MALTPAATLVIRRWLVEEPTEIVFFFVCYGTRAQRDAVVSGNNGTRTNRNTVFTLRVGICAIGVGLEVRSATGGYDIANAVFDMVTRVSRLVT